MIKSCESLGIRFWTRLKKNKPKENSVSRKKLMREKFLYRKLKRKSYNKFRKKKISRKK
jgi:hypothetical protein